MENKTLKRVSRMASHRRSSSLPKNLHKLECNDWVRLTWQHCDTERTLQQKCHWLRFWWWIKVVNKHCILLLLVQCLWTKWCRGSKDQMKKVPLVENYCVTCIIHYYITKEKSETCTMVPFIQICHKSWRIGCVIPLCNLQCRITQPTLQLFWHICTWYGFRLIHDWAVK